MLTPETIANKTFRRTLLGYDLEQVDDFLDEIILQFQQMERERKEMSDTIEYLAAELRRLSPETGRAPETEEEIALPMSPHEAMERATYKAQPSEEKRTKGPKGEKRKTKKAKPGEKPGAEVLPSEKKAEKSPAPEETAEEITVTEEAPAEETNTEAESAKEAPAPEAPEGGEAPEEDAEQEEGKQGQKEAPSRQEAHEDGYEEA